MKEQKIKTLIGLVNQARDAQTVTEVRSIHKKMEGKLRAELDTQPEQICPMCGGVKGQEYIVCETCWDKKDHDKIEQKYK